MIHLGDIMSTVGGGGYLNKKIIGFQTALNTHHGTHDMPQRAL